MNIPNEIDNLAAWINQLKLLAQDDLQQSDLELISGSIEKFRKTWAERLMPEHVTPDDVGFILHKLRTPFNTIVGLTQTGVIDIYSGLDEEQSNLYEQVYQTGLAMLEHMKTIYTML